MYCAKLTAGAIPSQLIKVKANKRRIEILTCPPEQEIRDADSPLEPRKISGGRLSGVSAASFHANAYLTTSTPSMGSQLGKTEAEKRWSQNAIADRQNALCAEL